MRPIRYAAAAATAALSFVAFAGPASANTGTVRFTCQTITVTLDHFPAGLVPGVQTVNGADTPFTVTGPAATVTAPRPDGPVQVYWSATGDQGNLYSGAGYDDGTECAPTTTEAPTTTVAPTQAPTTEPPVTEPPVTEPPATLPPIVFPTTTVAPVVPTCGTGCPPNPPPTAVVEPTTAVAPTTTSTVAKPLPPATVPTVPPGPGLPFTGPPADLWQVVAVAVALLLAGLPLLAVHRRA